MCGIRKKKKSVLKSSFRTAACESDTLMRFDGLNENTLTSVLGYTYTVNPSNEIILNFTTTKDKQASNLYPNLDREDLM